MFRINIISFNISFVAKDEQNATRQHLFPVEKPVQTWASDMNTSLEASSTHPIDRSGNRVWLTLFVSEHQQIEKKVCPGALKVKHGFQ